MITYECWKCPKQHKTDLLGAFSAMRYASAMVSVTLFGRTFPIMSRKLFHKWQSAQRKALQKRYKRKLTRH